jgi:hypothetical protein
MQAWGRIQLDLEDMRVRRGSTTVFVHASSRLPPNHTDKWVVAAEEGCVSGREKQRPWHG